MKIDLTKEEIELVLTGLSHAQTGIRQTLDSMSSLEVKMLSMLDDEDDCIDNSDCSQSEDAPKPRESFFYGTFNFEVEQESLEGRIISDTHHLRFINGKQGQLGIESGDRGVDKYRPMFISKDDKPVLRAIFSAILDTRMRSGAVLCNRLCDIYNLSDRKYTIKISTSQAETILSLCDRYGEEKYQLIIPDVISKKYLQLNKADGTSALFESALQLSTLIDFINYHL